MIYHGSRNQSPLQVDLSLFNPRARLPAALARQRESLKYSLLAADWGQS